MISSVLSVASQVVILFVIIAIGFILTKIKFITKVGIESITNIVLYAVTPCVIINSFQREFEASMIYDLLIAFLIAFIVLSVSVLVAEFLYRNKGVDKAVVLKFAIVFSNCGFMGLPLQEAILGKDGIFFGAAFLGIFNVFMWTYGIIIMSGKKDRKSILKVMLNPGIIGTIIALLFFVFKITLPTIIATPISIMSALNTPLPMIIIGYYLASANLKKSFKDKDCYLAVIMRLVIIPLVVLFMLSPLHLNKTMVIAIVIATAAPAAAMSSMMSTKYNHDTELAVSIITVSHILSLITIPIIISIAQMIL